MSKSQRLLSLLNHRLKIQTQDGKTIVGQMIAFDKHLNIVLADCEEYRTIRSSTSSKRKSSSNQQHPDVGADADRRQERRTLGLVILRGEVIVSMEVESGAPPESSSRKRQSALAELTGGQGLPSQFATKGHVVAPQLPIMPVLPRMPPAAGVMGYGQPPQMPGMPPMYVPGMPVPPPMLPQMPGMPMFPHNSGVPMPPQMPGMPPPPPPKN